MYKIAGTIEAGVAANRALDAVSAALEGKRLQAAIYLGDATLSFMGLSTRAIKRMRVKCFVGGTLVHTADGQKPIEKIEKDERVWAYDKVQKEWRLCRVLQTFKNVSKQLATVMLSNGECITGTNAHPFWVIEGERLNARPGSSHGLSEDNGTMPGRWVDMLQLRPGDVLWLYSGKTARVQSVMPVSELRDVYNLEVEDLHSYAVGESGVWVHNTGEECESAANLAAKAAKTDIDGATSKTAQVSASTGVVPKADVKAPATVKPASALDDVGVLTPLVIRKNWAPVAITDPRMAGGCAKVAQRIKKLLGGGDIKHIKPKEGGFVGPFREKNWNWSEHIVVVKDGKIFDATTGCKGMVIDEYKSLWGWKNDLDFNF